MRDHNIKLHDSKSAINNSWDGNPGLADVYSVHPLPQNSQNPATCFHTFPPNYHTCVTPLTLLDGKTPLMWLLSRDTESSSTFMRADEVTKSEAILHKLFKISQCTTCHVLPYRLHKLPVHEECVKQSRGMNTDKDFS